MNGFDNTNALKAGMGILEITVDSIKADQAFTVGTVAPGTGSTTITIYRQPGGTEEFLNQDITLTGYVHVNPDETLDNYSTSQLVLIGSYESPEDVYTTDNNIIFDALTPAQNTDLYPAIVIVDQGVFEVGNVIVNATDTGARYGTIRTGDGGDDLVVNEIILTSKGEHAANLLIGGVSGDTDWFATQGKVEANKVTLNANAVLTVSRSSQLVIQGNQDALVNNGGSIRTRLWSELVFTEASTYASSMFVASYQVDKIAINFASKVIFEDGLTLSDTTPVINIEETGTISTTTLDFATPTTDLLIESGALSISGAGAGDSDGNGIADRDALIAGTVTVNAGGALRFYNIPDTEGEDVITATINANLVADGGKIYAGSGNLDMSEGKSIEIKNGSSLDVYKAILSTGKLRIDDMSTATLDERGTLDITGKTAGVLKAEQNVLALVTDKVNATETEAFTAKYDIMGTIGNKINFTDGSLLTVKASDVSGVDIRILDGLLEAVAVNDTGVGITADKINTTTIEHNAISDNNILSGTLLVGKSTDVDGMDILLSLKP